MKLDVGLKGCPNCQGELRTWRQKRVDGVNYTICTCRNCGLGIVNPRPSAQDLEGYYQKQGHSSANPQVAADVLKAEKNYPNSTLDARRMVRDIRALTGGKSGRLLDVGCGYALFTREAIAQGFQVTAIEMAETERQIAQEIAGIQPLDTPFEEFDSAEPFDAILMSQVLEHSADPVLWLQKAHSLLRPGGIIAIAVPNFGSLFRRVLQDKDPFIIPPAHLNYFSPGNLQQLLQHAGFKVQKSYTISRLPPHVIARRLRLASTPLVPVIDALQNVGPSLMDKAAVGMFINVFAAKLA